MQFECLPLTTSPESLLGLLQRGRGAGWLGAVADPTNGRAALLDCLENDPRLDHQAESRASYYATLAMALEVPATEVAACADHRDDEWLVPEVLASMAARGDSHAQRLDDSDPRGGALLNTPVRRAPRQELPPLDSPLADILAGEAPRPRRAVLDRLTNTTDAREIAQLQAAAQDPKAPGFRLALRVLGERGDDSLVASTGRFLATRPIGARRAAMIGYLTALPADVGLALARDWFGVDDGRADVATTLMARHAEPSDVPAVRAALAAMVNTYAQCDLVDALARVPELGPYPELREVYVGACYSYLRRRAVRAIRATDPTHLAEIAIECLWDCEEEIREMAAALVPLTAPVTRRLLELADDPTEEDSVRYAARSRVTASALS